MEPSRPPKQIDLDGDQYREVGPTREPGQPVFKPGGVRWIFGAVAVLIIATALSYPIGRLHGYLVQNYPLVSR